MKNILKKMVVLKGVHHACFYQEGKDIISTFPEHQQSGLESAGEMISQMFDALTAINKSHNEVYFSLGDKFLVAYLLEHNNLILLLTEKRINFPLIHMGVKSATAKIKLWLATQNTNLSHQNELHPSIASSVTKTSSTKPSDTKPVEKKSAPSPKEIPIPPDVAKILTKMLDVLINFLGPAASFVFDDVVDTWKQNQPPTKASLNNLVNLLLKELDTESERQTFIQQIERIL